MSSYMPVGRNKSFNAAAGVRADFDKLMQDFRETKTVRYESFSQIWREMKMPLIFCGKRTKFILAEFVAECLHLASEYWLQSKNLQVQIGGLYLVYGIYETQPCDPKVHLMLTLTDWERVQKFAKAMQAQSHFDVCYIYRKLLMKRVFYYSASNKQVEIFKEIKADPPKKEPVEKPDRLSISELIDPSDINHLEALHTQYHVMKCALAGPRCTKPDPSLRVINSDLVTVIKQKVKEFEDWKRNPLEAGKERRKRLRQEWKSQGDDDDDDADEDYVPTRNRRAEIKAHAFKSATQVRRDRRHRQGQSPKRGRKGKTKSGSDYVSTEDEERCVLIPSAAGAGDSSNQFLSMPQMTELEASTSDQKTPSSRRKKTQDSPKATDISAPSKLPKILLSPKKRRPSKNQNVNQTSPKSTASSSTSKSKKGKQKESNDGAAKLPTVKKRGRPKKSEISDVVKEDEDLMDNDDVKEEEPDSLPDIPHTFDKKKPRSATTLRRKPQAPKAAAGRKRASSATDERGGKRAKN